MADLRSIDLTDGRRFERSMNQHRLDTTNRGTSRLKKGEVPHFSADNSVNYYLIPNDWITTNVTWSQSNDLTNDVSNTSTMINSWINTWHTFDTMESSFNVVSIDTDGWNVTYTPTKYNNKKYDTSNYSSLESRLSKDPFEEYWSLDAKSRLKKDKYEFYFDSRSDIKRRIEKDHFNERIGYDDRDLLREDNNNDKFDSMYREKMSRNDEMDFHAIEHNLKLKAPFIKRVYTRMNGHAFDSEDLRLEMVKAKENFEKAIKLTY